MRKKVAKVLLLTVMGLHGGSLAKTNAETKTEYNAQTKFVSPSLIWRGADSIARKIHSYEFKSDVEVKNEKIYMNKVSLVSKSNMLRDDMIKKISDVRVVETPKQKAFFFNIDVGSVLPPLEGEIVWSAVDEGENTIIRGDMKNEAIGLTARISIKPNSEENRRLVQARHVIEISFDVSDDATVLPKRSVVGLVAESAEHQAEVPLSGSVAFSTESAALFALLDSPEAWEKNKQLLIESDYLTILTVAENGSRSVFQLGKGEEGKKLFEEVIYGWPIE